MSTKTTLSLVIFSAILLSACTVKAPTGTVNQAGETQPTATQKKQPTTLREILSLGQNQKCTFTSTTTDDKGVKTDTTGTLYVSGKRMAEEIQITNSGNVALNTNMMMISDGIKIYTWDKSKKTPGMMFNMVEPTGTQDGAAQTQNQNVNLDEKVDTNCSPWVVDESKFTLPKDVKFTDLTELMKNIPTVPAVPGN